MYYTAQAKPVENIELREAYLPPIVAGRLRSDEESQPQVIAEMKTSIKLTQEDWANASFSNSRLPKDLLKEEPKPHNLRFDQRATDEETTYEAEKGRRRPDGVEKMGSALVDVANKATQDLVFRAFEFPVKALINALAGKAA